VRILVVNAGSSSLKLRVLDDRDEVLWSADLPAVHGIADRGVVEDAIRAIPRIDAVGHRIVHGGTRFREAVRVDAEVAAALLALTDLAPLHQPKSLAALEAVTSALPDLPAVACFDTAFHATMPEEAATFAVPSEWRTRWGVRRYGFHGLSHAYASRRAAELMGREPRSARVVTCHLGAGASLAAVAGGRSVDTTMGFTPLDGLVMATRSGAVDPGLVLWMIRHAGLAPAEVEDALDHASGLQALAGTPDMRAIVERSEAGDRDARTALAVYGHRLAAGVAAMAAAMGGLDGLVFTGGVGEHAPAVRADAGDRLSFLGVEIDDERNLRSTADAEIGAENSPVRTFMIEAREDLEIARQVRALLESPGPGPHV
jgi:acetate kinase